MEQQTQCQAQQTARYEHCQDLSVNPSDAPSLGALMQRRYGRRDVLRGTLAVSALAATYGLDAVVSAQASPQGTPRFRFDEIAHGVDTTHHVAPGYRADILIRWGDPVTRDAPRFDPANQTPEAQEQQFGYNNDFLGYLPLPIGSNNPDHGLLFVNHEYTNEELMFAGLGRQDGGAKFAGMTAQLIDIEMAAHGASVIEVQRTNGHWRVVSNSPYARRLSARSTVMHISGPAAGHARMQTAADRSGRRVIGTINNCAGGVTPWGTVLTAEENFDGYFAGLVKGHAEERNYRRYGVPGARYAWHRAHQRFDINQEPNEANRFGWVVEIDPYDPTSVPIKRTALGRFKHEGATPLINQDGRLVIYSGDDQRFEYLYKYVSDARVDLQNRANNARLLDEGTLFVARFHDDGRGLWLPLVWGNGPLTAANGFPSQADVLIETRRAADLLGATPMDRPEDVEPNPQTNKVYVMLTNNSKRQPDRINGVNPRAENVFGHILELAPPDGNHAAQEMRWEVLVKCGDPRIAAVGAHYHPQTSPNGWFASPDNAAMDSQSRLWVATDQGENWHRSGTADGLWGVETEGPLRGLSTMFFRAPVGAELCGPAFTPDDKALFLAVQHPAADGAKRFPGFQRNSTYDDPATRWPDFQDNMPPRPSVVVVTKNDGGVIGS